MAHVGHLPHGSVGRLVGGAEEIQRTEAAAMHALRTQAGEKVAHRPARPDLVADGAPALSPVPQAFVARQIVACLRHLSLAHLSVLTRLRTGEAVAGATATAPTRDSLASVLRSN